MIIIYYIKTKMLSRKRNRKQTTKVLETIVPKKKCKKLQIELDIKNMFKEFRLATNLTTDDIIAASILVDLSNDHIIIPPAIQTSHISEIYPEIYSEINPEIQHPEINQEIQYPIQISESQSIWKSIIYPNQNIIIPPPHSVRYQIYSHQDLIPQERFNIPQTGGWTIMHHDMPR